VVTELALWEKCYVMSQMLQTIDITKRGAANLRTLMPELVSLLEQAAEQLSPRGRAESARLS
jgi:hypothetical protein